MFLLFSARASGILSPLLTWNGTNIGALLFTLTQNFSCQLCLKKTVGCVLWEVLEVEGT